MSAKSLQTLSYGISLLEIDLWWETGHIRHLSGGHIRHLSGDISFIRSLFILDGES